VIAALTFRFADPWWLAAGLVAAPMVLLAWRNLAAVGRARRVAAVVLRVLVVALLAALLADPLLSQRQDQVTLIAVIDRSRSVPADQREASLAWLEEAMKAKRREDRLAVIDVGELALIEKLASTSTDIRRRATDLRGDQTDLAAGVQLGMAVAPPNAAVRLLVVSDGNETSGDLRDAAKVAAANDIPIDVLPLKYRYEREVFLKRIVSPPNARSGQTIALRFVLGSTAPAKGKLFLSLNGEPVDLDPASDGVAAEVALKPGTNTKTVSMPVGSRGLEEFEATFVPDDPADDTLAENNRASSMTYVAGPGHVLVVDEDGRAAAPLVKHLAASGINLKYIQSSAFPQSLPELLDTDAVILVNAPCAEFTLAQQELLCHFVRELGGGLVVVGGSQSFGAGGWIGSPVAEVLPVDLDPPQKKQMPKGALVLIMHSCEMPQGNYWGKEVAIAAVGTLSRLDLAGIISFGWAQGGGLWDYPLQAVGDKRAVVAGIKNMQMGDMPDFGGPMQEAYDALVASDAVQKHVIMISDGDPAPPSTQLMSLYKLAGITVSTVAVDPHVPTDVQRMVDIALATGGRSYWVKDPNKLPQIFIKEAQTVKRALINEEDFTPRVTSGLSELVRGLEGVPGLNGYVLTGPKGGAADLVMVGPEEDPILAAWQVGVGRSVAFTSSVDARWAARWLAWGGFARFWEQTVRWAARSRLPPDCTVFADVQGRDVTLTVEAVDREGNFVQYSGLTGRVVTPGMTAKDLPMVQTGPGQYRATFKAGESGSYLVNLRYEKVGGGGGTVQSVISVPYAPEFRDLSDNAPLLSAVAEETGGRVIAGPAEKADLFSGAGLKFPETPLPLARALMIAWLGLFLADVASRRLAVDVRAAARRALGWVKWPARPPAAEGEEHLARLQRRTRRLRKGMAAKAAEPHAARRFEAPKGAPAEMPEGLEPSAPPADMAPGSSMPTDEARGANHQTPEGDDRLNRLLKARRRAQQRMGKGKENENT